ncbi:MAG: helix-turn-helix domain-containing protein [Pedobacter sp.]|nr:helix-turn-helix domain-containing protein [Pedobacter sp.]MDQ8053093.1 helix-turn-helix domain-containing protein [Pedobacter sp.]
MNRIKFHYNLKNNTDLARFLGIETNTLSNWYKRNTLNYDLIFTKCEELNPNWIINGHGRPSKSYHNPEENPAAFADEAREYLRSIDQQEEVEKLTKVIAAQDQTIAAQAQTIMLMEKLIGQK